MTIVRRLARPMLSSMFLVGGMNAVRNPAGVAPRAEPVVERLDPVVSKAASRLPIELTTERQVMLNGAIQVAGGAMLATGRLPRLAAFALAATLVPTTIAGHRFWEESDPALRANQRIHFFKNVSMMGGLLLATVDTEGRPGLAWRARQGAKHARKSAAAGVDKITPG